MPTFSVSKKLFITFFLIMIGFAFFVACLNFYDRTGFSTAKSVRHYSGDEDNFNDDVDYDSNEKLLQEGFFFPKQYREILEITHVHAFMIPLVLFVLSRILSMTKINESIKITIYSTAFISGIINLLCPYLIRYKSDIFTIPLILSYFFMGFCFIAFISLPIYEMWFKKASDKNGKYTDYWL